MRQFLLLLLLIPREIGSFKLPLQSLSSPRWKGLSLSGSNGGDAEKGNPLDLFAGTLSTILPQLFPSPETAQKAERGSRDYASSRRESFWREVAFGLAEKFSFTEIQRVIDYTQYARGELSLPSESPVLGHEPCEEFVPGLTAAAYWDASEFSWAMGLTERSDEIRNELQSVLAKESERFAGDSALQTKVMGAGWSALRLQRLGRWNEDNCARFPKTTALLKELQVPTAMRGVMFARQRPGTAVARHSDGRNFVLTAHLGLSVPSPTSGSDCWISVAGEKRRWREGEVLVLDTSFHHETANESREPRDVLIVDFWHPELTPAEIEALEFIYDLRYEYDREIIEATSAAV